MELVKLIAAEMIVLLVAPLIAQNDKGTTARVADGDFFIVSSIDLAKNQILLKRLTEVTELMRVGSATRYLDDRGQSIRFSDLRAGDTIFVISKGYAGQSIAITIRRGAMTLDILRERYLKSAK